jgi:hypothetical protein
MNKLTLEFFNYDLGQRARVAIQIPTPTLRRLLAVAIMEAGQDAPSVSHQLKHALTLGVSTLHGEWSVSASHDLLLDNKNTGEAWDAANAAATELITPKHTE